LVTFISGVLSAMGALSGLAIGDAMGAPFEGGPPLHVLVQEMQSDRLRYRKRGQYTDDTLQAIAVAESLIVCRKFSPDDLIGRLIAGYKKFPEFYGPTSGSVFELVMTGVPPYRAALIAHDRNGGSRSNGSVMRGPPLGIFYRGPELREVSFCCSRLTHADPVAGYCSAWINRMVSGMCRGESRDLAFRKALSECPEGEVRDMLGDFGAHDPEPSLDALLGTHAALKVFMEGGSFAGIVSCAVSLGGDADTVGAIAGALAGAWSGISEIPKRWLYDLQDSAAIAGLGATLWELSQQ
jgi:ADP-ribosyl-[dinitrogen reductase] hydrolase